eukprot:CAMPEP_0183562088 /NCGR_PEP_ID=MMETSP0371-20130417/97155_1 /TAXON_ID=268820 /ORGANISM="Peridinium aciculiferum, Strain PAER-2" /LENGTH=218 /DNA_ID=CAMNT_0025770731 /DNA_START=45 /DNA_END=698 /DNA_ORIENTATION=-
MTTPGDRAQERPFAPIYALEDLRHFDGNGPDGTILIGVLGRVFNVTSGTEFYAKGQGYSVFAGHDCTHAFAIASTKAKHLDLDLDDLPHKKLDHLNSTYWETYVAKYPIIGRLTNTPYDPSRYDHLAGPYAEIRVSAGAHPRRARAGKRQSRCPVTRAARAIGSTLANLIPRALAPPSWAASSAEDGGAPEGGGDSQELDGAALRRSALPLQAWVRAR